MCFTRYYPVLKHGLRSQKFTACIMSCMSLFLNEAYV